MGKIGANGTSQGRKQSKRDRGFSKRAKEAHHSLLNDNQLKNE